jgi:translation initiation factor IF-3
MWTALCSPFFIIVRRCKTISETVAINEQIRDREVRLVGESGEQLGIMSARDAYLKAQEAGLDLIKIAPNAKPPVCKICDFGKYKYEQLRRDKEAKKRQKEIEVKEIRISPNIDENDLKTKANQARKFLEKGDKVKITLRFHGREMSHLGSNTQIMTQFVEILSDIALQEKAPKMEGKSLSVTLAQKK